MAEHHYALLGVHWQASAEEIRAARKVLAQRLHPDRNPAGAQAMAEVNVATAVLLGPGATKYHASIGRGLCSVCRGQGWQYAPSGQGARRMKAPCRVCKGAGRV